MKKKLAYAIGASVCIWIAIVLVHRASAEHNKHSEGLPTYFSYSSKEVEELKKLNSKAMISTQSLQKWDQVTAKFVHRSRLSHFDAQRLYTYLYNAQRDAAFLSYNAHDHFEGSLDPIAESVLRLFISEYTRPSEFTSDPYSEKLAAIVLSKYKPRFEKENALSLEFTVPPDMMARKETAYQVGASIAKWIPWYATPEINYRAPNPPPEGDPEWGRQVMAIKQAQKNLSEEQRNIINFWAGLSGPDSGDWRVIANNYMFENEIPLGKMLLVRSVLMMTIYDATLANFDSKYHYHVVRPQVKDPSVPYVIPCPNHPSYPSGHSTTSTASAVILSYYFPENGKEWKRLANEAGLSRIWAGIHYPIDNIAGQQIGKKVAETVIKEQD